MFILLLLVCLIDQSLRYSSAVSAAEVFYVKPTGPTPECPSGDSPCHSLQYYANHSSFTNNSLFLFLEGEHHLDSVVDIRNVANLSLVGNSSGVEILCKSIPAGFKIVEFNGLNILNMAMTNCRGQNSASVYLQAGSEASLGHVTVTTSVRGLFAIDLEGSFVVSNSTFTTAQGNGIQVIYQLCSRPSQFILRNTKQKSEANGDQLFLSILCSGVQVLITDSIFEHKALKGRESVLILNAVFTNNSILVTNSTFEDANLLVAPNDEHCNHDFFKFSGVKFTSLIITLPAKNCTILIEDSTLSGSVTSSNYPRLVISNPYNTAPKTFTQAILRNVTFANNIVESPVSILANATVLFVNCIFQNNTQSAIRAILGSKVIFQGNTVFKNNSALLGGGIQLLDSSQMYLQPNASILFEDNHAAYVGGAIYTDYKEHDNQCLFHIESPTLNNAHINFVSNSAGFSGSALYGGGIASCEHIFNIQNTEEDPSAVASDPYNVCFCGDGKRQPECSNHYRTYSTHAFPGQEFPIRLAVVDYSFNGVVPGAVRAYFSSSSRSSLGSFQKSQTSDKPYCENFNYSVNSTAKRVTFKLVAEQSYFEEITKDPNFQYLSLIITVHMKDCPLGFDLSPTTGTCVCDPVFVDNNIQCLINNQSFLRPANSWMGFVDETSNASNISGVMFHPNCPTGHCLPGDVSITSNTSDSQCEPHRTGLLCGECEEGYSLTLGDGKCVECSNTYLLLILPLAVAGLFLVAVLFTLNLTVTEGSINGLIFYANVVGMNYKVLFSDKTNYLYTFLAWLNLDLGIHTCLYDGLDGYAESWLQFIFPVYLWVIILVIIGFYRKFPRLANRLGRKNAVKVLATLFLLSYTKLQRTVVTILSFTRLEHPDGVDRYVWLYDANLVFFQGKHLFLGIAGILVLVLLIVPYTLCLTFFQQLQACSGHRLFQWVNKLKPVFDAYAGPYKDKYRFWTGMLLLVRTLLIILFTINTAGSVDFNLLIILVVSFIMLMVNSNGTYKKWPYNYLESFFYLQLGVFAAGVAYARLTHGNIGAVADSSIALTLLVFLAVLGYHLLCRLTCLKKYYYRLTGYADIVEELTDERII